MRTNPTSDERSDDFERGSDARPRSSIVTAPSDPGARSADRPERPCAPAFTPDDRHCIAAWSDRLRRLGLSVEFNTGHRFLAEALHIASVATPERIWVIHKTPDNRVAVREWPGTADLVASLTDALVLVASAHSIGPRASAGA
jgi:hypothetical protein